MRLGHLGYATTIHAAQGATADVVHGVVTGEETRQQLYTMLTRGKRSNHAYVQVVGDGDLHTLPRPETTTTLPTPVDLLANILARDGAATSATTCSRVAQDTATLLGQATGRYVDALHAAAEHQLGPNRLARLEQTADRIVPGLPDAPAWPTLRGRLVLAAADGHDPALLLWHTAHDRLLDDADDPAAVLTWRLHTILTEQADEPTEVGVPERHGPLPWLPPIPALLAADPQWGDYLHRRQRLVTGLAEQLRDDTLADLGTPGWAAGRPRLQQDLVADVQVYRAATGVDPADQRPLGPTPVDPATTAAHRALSRRLSGHDCPAWDQFGHLITAVVPECERDEFAPVLAQRLAAVNRAGLPAPTLLRAAATEGVLPDEHPAAALWWRLTRHLTPAVAADSTAPNTNDWIHQLPTLLGEPAAHAVQVSPAWPTLAATVDHALAAGWPLPDLLSLPDGTLDDGDDPCQVLLWRAAVALRPVPDGSDHIEEPDHGLDPDDVPPPDVQDDRALLATPGTDWTPLDDDAAPEHDDAIEWPTADDDAVVAAVDDDPELAAEAQLAWCALVREARPGPELSDAAIERMVRRAHEWDEVPITRQRLLEVNELAVTYYQDQFPDSWVRDYLADRLRTDVAGDPGYRPGYAPAGWTTLVTHLRRLGVTDEELLVAGLASTASTGRLIDRFRDRLVLPIISRGEILGFTARRHPNAEPTTSGPKYLNTPDTPLFHKGAQLYGWGVGSSTDSDPIEKMFSVRKGLECRSIGNSHLNTARRRYAW